MSIDLLCVLKRNKTNLKSFIAKNHLINYDILLQYCRGRKFVPCSKEMYEEAKGKKDESKQLQPAKKPAPKKTTTRRKRTAVKKESTRKVSPAPKPKGRRTSAKKQSKS